MKKKEKEYIKLQVSFLSSLFTIIVYIGLFFSICNLSKIKTYGWVCYFQERLNQVMMEKKKESRSGMEIMNLLQVASTFFFVVGYMCPFVFQSVTVPLICFYRKKGVNVGHGMGRRLTMTSTRRL